VPIPPTRVSGSKSGVAMQIDFNDPSNPVYHDSKLGSSGCSKASLFVIRNIMDYLGFPCFLLGLIYRRLHRVIRLAVDSKVLVTGATGFLGKRLVKKLRGMNLNVVAADLQVTDEIVSLDVRDKESVNAVLESSMPEVVVHLAAINDNNPNFDRPYDLYVNNIQGTLNICEAATRFGVRKIVFPSSTSIYGNVQDENLPISEMTRTHPLTPYATSKVCEEMLVRDYARRTNTKALMFRFSIIYGPEQKHANVIEQFMRKAISGDPIELLGDGSHTREFLYVDDAIDALVVSTNAASLPYDTYLISTGNPIKLTQLAEKISKLIDPHAPILNIQSKEPIFSQHYDVSRAMTNLNWKPRVSIDVGLSLMLEWVRGPS